MFMLITALAIAPAQPVAIGAASACTGTPAATPGIGVNEVPVSETGYRTLRATAVGGAYLPVYFDPAGESAARRYAPCLAMELALLRGELDDTRVDAEWSPVVFTSDPAYLPPRGPGVKPRWRVAVDARGTVDADGRSTITRLVPHEQVHVWQGRAQARLPRWFSEGHATWVGLKVTAAIEPALAVKEREAQALELTLSKTPLTLASWGSVRPRRDAIMRQVSPEDRAKMEADPSYTPQGAFRFTSADFIGDESNMKARYAGAWRVFDGLEARHGAAKVRAFALEATAQPGMHTPPMMAELVRKHFGETLDTLLAEPAK